MKMKWSLLEIVGLLLILALVLVLSRCTVEGHIQTRPKEAEVQQVTHTIFDVNQRYDNVKEIQWTPDRSCISFNNAESQWTTVCGSFTIREIKK